VAPSNANVVYVGTGETDIRSQHSYGIGMYKSADAGKTWNHIGLEGTRQIGRIVVDPSNANRVYVAALSHGYASNTDCRVCCSLDGGTPWTKVLFKTNDIGAVDLAVNPGIRACSRCAVGYAVTPWWFTSYQLAGGGLYKSRWRRYLEAIGGRTPTDQFVSESA
jgi:hypothetical protein